MSLLRLVKWLRFGSWAAFAVCIFGQTLAVLAFEPPVKLFAALFLSVFLIGGATSIIQFRIVLIEQDWLLGSYETLFRRFPIWVVLLSVALVLAIVAQAFLQPTDHSYLSLALAYSLEAGALSSLHRQPWLLGKAQMP